MSEINLSAFSDRQDLFTYIPATLKEYKNSWRIEYSCLDPESKILSRQQIRVDAIRKRFATKREARTYFAVVCQNINAKLAGGWNPLLHSEDSRVYTPLLPVLELFLKEKKMELRENTLRSYVSWVNMFKAWMESENMLNIIVGRVNKIVAVKYMDHVYMERGVSAVTYNNQLKIGRCVFNWMKEKGYVNDNPFEQLKPKKANKKKRVLIDENTRMKIRNYLEDNDKVEFLVVLELVYNSLIRPKEIAMIQLKHINLEKKYIVIPGENAKNHNERYAALSDELIERLRGLGVDRHPQNYYLFGGVGLKIAKVGCKRNRLTKEWTRIRKKLNLSDEMQMYSLRDTGITEMLRGGIESVTVMKHADHHDLAMTTRYANHVDVNLVDKINRFAPKF